MQIRNLGGSGLRVSAVGLGCNNFGQRTDLETSRKVIHKAIDLGITLFDTADIYAGMGGSETVLGTVLGDRRKDIVLATKYSKPMSNDGTRQGGGDRGEPGVSRVRVERVYRPANRGHFCNQQRYDAGHARLRARGGGSRGGARRFGGRAWRNRPGRI